MYRALGRTVTNVASHIVACMHAFTYAFMCTEQWGLLLQNGVQFFNHSSWLTNFTFSSGLQILSSTVGDTGHVITVAPVSCTSW